ncbi:zinc finger, c2h2 type domain containing protein [Trypanosoma conorhini]|uniref:Zinc finger, c2h2 type domain containing protein n=1 Tax=Trypanosoma conorhini TaxID=83891 RepID=A0A422PCZ5_9TRYP|nr:zinc finger, c2h2 type domain containing protein [Trypanosoma conorhini]RNF15560.1 zinc finger, c2h2 type domain containing protein [Trypanosoma conorhini]
MANRTGELEPVECLVCATACEAIAVFNCGHYVCYVCGLHIHSIDHGACPVCREKGETVIVTRTLPGENDDEDKFSTASVQAMEDVSVFDTQLQCFVQGNSLATEMSKMYECVCPVPKCWRRGVQEPFCELYPLREHLRIEHRMEYCGICLQHRSVFLCEQQVYSRETLQLHMDGVCPHDAPAFLGHPFCRFCAKSRFYDEDHLLEHMKHHHFTCDVCNRSEFLFRYYENRQKLLQHFEQAHQLCDHPACASLDPMMRVFASDLELALHKQRVHGVRSRVALFMADNSSANPSSSPPTTTSPATRGNANVISITFDHVHRQDTVKLMQKCAHSGGGVSAGGPKGKRKGGDKIRMGWVRGDAPGLPLHFRIRGVLSPLMRRGRERAAEPHSALASGAFGVSESAETYNSKNKVPLDRNELQCALDAALREELPELHQMQDFRACTAEFMSGRMLTMRYYNCLRTEFFPSEGAFQKVFPLLVATVPLPERRDALVQIEKMRHAPEVLHAQRMQEEDAKKKRDAEKWQKQYELLARIEQKSNRRKGNVAGGHNVWLERGSAALLSRAHEQQSEAQPQEQQRRSQQPSRGNNNNNGSTRPSSAQASLPATAHWGTTHEQQQLRPSLLPTGTGYYQDPDDFPELPTTNPRLAWGRSQAKRSQRPNAWNCKRI